MCKKTYEMMVCLSKVVHQILFPNFALTLPYFFGCKSFLIMHVFGIM